MEFQPALSERLWEQRHEIEQAIATRVYSVSDPAEVGDIEYVAGLRSAVSVAVYCALRAVEGGSSAPEAAIPPQLLAQARHAAQCSVPLDTVLRRYLAGHTLLCDFVLREASKQAGSWGVYLQRSLGSLSGLLDRLLVAVTEAYREEKERRFRTPEQRQFERVRRVLDGEAPDGGEINYDFEGSHLAIVGSGAASAIRDIVGELGCRLLLVRTEAQTVWAWLGSKRLLSARETLARARANLPPKVSMAIGEPAMGVEGWRMSHRQAMAALPLAQRGVGPLVRYADVALLASVRRDELLIDSLSCIYLAPLAASAAGQLVAKETLKAYFGASRNMSAAAAVLGVSRQTVASRLRVIEERLGRSLESCALEMEVAVRVTDIDGREPVAP